MNQPMILAIVAALGAACLVGCGKSDFPTAKTKGRVTYQGQGVPDIGVCFAPQADSQKANPGKPAVGVSDASGNFVLSTYEMEDGAVVGSHQISLSRDPEKGAMPGKAPDGMILEVKPGENDFQIELK